MTCIKFPFVTIEGGLKHKSSKLKLIKYLVIVLITNKNYRLKFDYRLLLINRVIRIY